MRRRGASLLRLCPAVRALTPADDLASHPVGAWGVDLGDQDRSVRPGDDFYRFQNGAWLARTELGPHLPMSAYWRDLRRWRRTSIAILTTSHRGRRVARGRGGKAATFYRAFMEQDAVEKKGVSPLEPDLGSIPWRRLALGDRRADGADRGRGDHAAIRELRSPLGRGLFRVDISQDPGDPSRSAVFLSQAGLLLPGPEFYLEAQFADVRTAFEAYAAQMLEAIGWPDARARAREVVAFETRVAEASWSHEQLLDSVATYNPLTVAELAALAPAFDWRAFLQGAELERVERVVVDAKSAFPGLAAAFAATPLETLRARLALAVVDTAAPFLNAALGEAQQAFRGRVLGNSFLLGVDRSLRAERTAEGTLADLLGSLYVARYSSPEAKARAEEMASRLRAAFDARLASSAWLSPAGRAAAREKLDGWRSTSPTRTASTTTRASRSASTICTAT